MDRQLAQFEQIIDNILTKGYCIIDDFLDKTEVDILLTTFDSKYQFGAFKQANIGKKTEEKTETTIRGDQILWLSHDTSNPAELSFFKKITTFSNYLNKTCYLGISGSEFHYSKYEKGKFYKRHRDAFVTKKGRVLSIIVYLNTNWKLEDGGELIIYLPEDTFEKHIKISPIAGRIVCFESEKLDHEVFTTQTKRMSITGWLLNN
jgi:SM-20-related protein